MLPTDWLKNISSTRQDSQRWPRGVLTIAAGARRSPAGHRRDIGRQFGHLRMKSTDGRTVSRRRSSGDHWVSLRLCSRSRISGGDQRILKNSNPAKIQPKSSSHRSIYVVLWPRHKSRARGICNEWDITIKFPAACFPGMVGLKKNFKKTHLRAWILWWEIRGGFWVI